MTTSEFIIGHSADDAAERKAELRKIGWALFAALILHLVIGFFLATCSGYFFSDTTPIEEEDKPIEMTMMNLPADQSPPVPKNTMFMETDESKATKEAPKEKTFESNANSIAAAEVAAKGNAPLPSQEGKDRPLTDMETHAYSLPIEGAQPQPTAPPQETPQASAIPESTPVENVDQLAMLTSTPKPTPQPTVVQQPERMKSAYRPMKEKTRIAGNISRRGISSVNALGTPLGRYQKVVMDSIGSRWYAYVERRGDGANVGNVVVHFVIDRSGRLRDMKIIENSSNETFANICLQAIQDSPFPPIPDDVAATLPAEGLEIEALRFSMF